VYVQSPTNCMYSITLGVLVCACMRFAWRKSFIAVEFYNHPFIAIENYRFPSLPSIWNFWSPHCHYHCLDRSCFISCHPYRYYVPFNVMEGKEHHCTMSRLLLGVRHLQELWRVPQRARCVHAPWLLGAWHGWWGCLRRWPCPFSPAPSAPLTAACCPSMRRGGGLVHLHHLSHHGACPYCTSPCLDSCLHNGIEGNKLSICMAARGIRYVHAIAMKG